MEKAIYYPTNYPAFMSGKLTYKVKVKEDYIRTDGTCAIYIQLFLNKEKKIIPLNISAAVKNFDKIKQRTKAAHPYCKDHNLIIEKKLADINTIEVNYRLSGKSMTIASLMDELDNPTARIDFIKFWEHEMKRQKDILKPQTYCQQKSVLNKVKNFKNPLFFYEIDEDYIQSLKIHCKKKLKNSDATIGSMVKSFKKYLHIANKKGIATPIMFNEIKNKRFKGNRTFLSSDEIIKLDEFWGSKFINETYKNILSRFLFSCFTGLRISDINNLSEENLIENNVVFTSEKTGKFQRIPMNVSAKKYINPKTVFDGDYTGQYINRELKGIAKVCGIKKLLTYHVSRHTFATNFLICGGRVENLQKILGHSTISDTMIYVHIVDQITDAQIHNMDAILATASPTSSL